MRDGTSTAAAYAATEECVMFDPSLTQIGACHDQVDSSRVQAENKVGGITMSGDQ